MWHSFDYDLSYNKPKRDKFKETNGHYDASNKKMTNLAHPSDTNDAATKQYVDESFNECLRLDKRKYDIGGRRLTGLIPPSEDSDAVSKKYVDDEIEGLASENFVEGIRDNIIDTLDDLATTKYVDDSIAALQPDQGEEGEEKDFAKKEDLDKLEKQLDTARKEVVEMKKKQNSFSSKPLFFQCDGTHDNENFVKFNTKHNSKGNFRISKDKRTLTFPKAGVWEITLIDMTTETKDKNISMFFTNMGVSLSNSKLTMFSKKRKRVGDWQPIYFSRIVPLAAGATLKIGFDGGASVGFDGEQYSEIIIKEYL